MNESLPEKQIPAVKSPLEDQGAYFEARPEDVTSAYLNNLYFRLPDSSHRAFSASRLSPEEKQFLADVDAALAELPEVQQALKDVEIDRARLEAESAAVGEQVKALMTELRDVPKEEKMRRFQEEAQPLYKRHTDLAEQARQPQKQNEALVPLYHALRKKGYSHYQIVK